jgi:hypothetical protein
VAYGLPKRIILWSLKMNKKNWKKYIEDLESVVANKQKSCKFLIKILKKWKQSKELLAISGNNFNIITFK